MKTFGNLYERFCSFENLLCAYNKAQRGKRGRGYVRAFDYDLEMELPPLLNRILQANHGEDRDLADAGEGRALAIGTNQGRRAGWPRPCGPVTRALLSGRDGRP